MTFMEIDHEIVSTVILPLLPFQEGQVSITQYWWKSVHKVSLHRESVSSLADQAGLGGSVGCASDWTPGGHGFEPHRGRQHSFMEIDHEIFSPFL